MSSDATTAITANRTAWTGDDGTADGTRTRRHASDACRCTRYGRPRADVLTDPPLLIIEILPPDDSYSDTQERAQDYRDMGVETVWIIDPKTRTGRMCSGSKWTEARQLVVSGTPLYVDLDSIFSQINSEH